LRGAVVDKSGAAVLGAKVTLASPTQGLRREMLTSNTGEYEFIQLPPGNYALTVEMAGFRKFEQRNLALLVNLPATVNVALEIGTTSDYRSLGAGCHAEHGGRLARGRV
jgi:hypothetical protein